jgi:hypothetical protein
MTLLDFFEWEQVDAPLTFLDRKEDKSIQTRLIHETFKYG